MVGGVHVLPWLLHLLQTRGLFSAGYMGGEGRGSVGGEMYGGGDVWGEGCMGGGMYGGRGCVGGGNVWGGRGCVGDGFIYCHGFHRLDMRTISARYRGKRQGWG